MGNLWSWIHPCLSLWTFTPLQQELPLNPAMTRYLSAWLQKTQRMDRNVDSGWISPDVL